MKKFFLWLFGACIMLWGGMAAAAPLNEPVCLVWQQQFKVKDVPLDKAIPAPVNVISPCWFDITNAGGDIQQSPAASLTYVRRAHKEGRQVWALVTNSFEAEMTGKLLRSPLGRRHVIRQLEELCVQLELDGINLDFENIADEDRALLTDFTADIARELHQQGKVVSIDVTVPSHMPYWSQCYDRKALAEAVDYLIVMAYDEYGPGSKSCGSVASLPWVEQGIQNTLQEGVPKEKLVLGMPLYMRIWEETSDKKRATTLHMPAAEKLWREKGLQREWLEQEGQYYFEYQNEGKRYRVWQEDARSLALKSALISRYDLAGGALWKSGVETDDVWEVLAKGIQKAECF